MHPSDAFALIVFCLGAIPASFLIGWLVCTHFIRRQIQTAPLPREAAASQPDAAAEAMLRLAGTAFHSFCEVTDVLNRDVGSHGEKLAAATTSLKGGSPSNVDRIVSVILEANACLQGQLVAAQATIRQQAHELEERMHEANSDALTGIANRRAFDLELERQMARFTRYGTQFTLMLLDIDHFKHTNDRHGHLAGDAVLRAIAEVLKGELRDVDFVARFGGEEFAVILNETDHRGGLAAGDRLRKAIAAAQIPWEQTRLSVTVSVGLAAASNLEDAAGILKRADEALYISKQSGRNRTTLASSNVKPNTMAVAG